ncbi:MAG TPA: MBL fold metallo-hydrolase [Anaerolineae bacterium]|nr:MBL fold metallo-hydrolase [Anaerolineae bacterium]
MIGKYKLHTIDLHFQGLAETIASYVIEGSEGLVMIETGPGSTLENGLAGLTELGFKPEDVRHILLTHIHFDHAGAAGWWAQQGAHIYVHHFGAQHLIDPAKLIASAGRIYGDQMGPLWGDILPAPAENVTSLYDGDRIEAGSLTFIAHETPGHARHHHVYQLEDIAFTGDAAGILLPEFNLPDIPAPPPEFDLEVWLETVDKIGALPVEAIYPTHYGRIADKKSHLTAIKRLLQESADFVKERMDAGMDRDTLLDEYTQWNRKRAQQAGLSEEGILHYETVNPLYMSVDGIIRYWRKRATAD